MKLKAEVGGQDLVVQIDLAYNKCMPLFFKHAGGDYFHVSVKSGFPKVAVFFGNAKF